MYGVCFLERGAQCLYPEAQDTLELAVLVAGP